MPFKRGAVVLVLFPDSNLRTSHTPLYALRLAWFVFYAWQAAIVLGGLSLFAGWNGGKEYAELEWPFDIAITDRIPPDATSSSFSPS